MVEEKKFEMEYRYLGNTGLKVSILSFGNMVNSSGENTQERHDAIVAKLLSLGVNFLDTAEVYGFGECEKLLGQSLVNLNVKRESVVISTKLFMGG
jgi:aryl-alcohol dehydrogenase-like predicted oxidoreductase